MSMRTNPFDELERLFDRMSRQFDDASYMWGSESPARFWGPNADTMAVDLVDRDDEFVATVDLPGFEREDVELRVSDHVLHIEADHEERVDEEDERYIHHERRHATMERSIRLPDEVDTKHVSARMKNGVLTITLPKVEVEESSSVDIEIE